MNPSEQLFKKESYNVIGIEDEIRVDRLCHEILIKFHADLVADKNSDPLISGSMARGADYFLRDYMIDRMQCNIFDINPELLRGFGGNWYIINNIDPSLKELAGILSGIKGFYNYSRIKGLLWQDMYESIAAICDNLAFFQERIESFLSLEGDGYLEWQKKCPLP